MTQWNHLPVAGGLYDQHPRLLEEWDMIHQMKTQYEAAQQKREMAQHKRPTSTKSKRR